MSEAEQLGLQVLERDDSRLKPLSPKYAQLPMATTPTPPSTIEPKGTPPDEVTGVSRAPRRIGIGVAKIGGGTLKSTRTCRSLSRAAMTRRCSTGVPAARVK